MPDTPAEQAWTPPVHDLSADLADLPLYDRLYAVTESLAVPRLQDSLRAVTAGSLADDLTQSLQSLAQFLAPSPDAAEDGHPALGPLDPGTVAALGSSLATHLQRTSPKLQRKDSEAAERRVAEQLAAELARSLWSTLLDHGARAHCEGLVAPERLMPGWPEGGITSPLHDKLRHDLLHFSQPLDVLIELSQATMERLAGSDGGSASVRLPQGLRVDKLELRAFLNTQKQVRARQSVRPTAAPRVDRVPKWPRPTPWPRYGA